MPFDRVLIVEDLEEPRKWLAELLPDALSCIKHISTAADLRQAFELLQTQTWNLAIVDWHLPDGTSEQLIEHLVLTQPEIVVVVATIHDDDKHVFPALRAGATGYILKSQPRAVVISQLKRLEAGEPALSPSIAQRLLRHFSQHQPMAGDEASTSKATIGQAETSITLTPRETDVLRLIAKGFSSQEAGKLLSITTHTVNSYVRDMYAKLGIRSRAEATLEASKRGLVS